MHTFSKLKKNFFFLSSKTKIIITWEKNRSEFEIFIIFFLVESVTWDLDVSIYYVCLNSLFKLILFRIYLFVTKHSEQDLLGGMGLQKARGEGRPYFLVYSTPDRKIGLVDVKIRVKCRNITKQLKF